MRHPLAWHHVRRPLIWWILQSVGFGLSLASTLPAILLVTHGESDDTLLHAWSLTLIILFPTVFLAEPSQEIWSCFSKIKVLQIILPHPCCSWKDRGEMNTIVTCICTCTPFCFLSQAIYDRVFYVRDNFLGQIRAMHSVVAPPTGRTLSFSQ